MKHFGVDHVARGGDPGWFPRWPGLDRRLSALGKVFLGLMAPVTVGVGLWRIADEGTTSVPVTLQLDT